MPNYCNYYSINSRFSTVNKVGFVSFEYLRKVMTRHSFTIFISGSCRDAGQAVSNLRFLCERYLKNNHKVRMIDVELYPGAAEEYGIMVTPTLIKNCEHEEFRVVGDLRDAEEVFQVLGFDSSTDEPESIAQLHPTTTPSVRREGNQ